MVDKTYKINFDTNLNDLVKKQKQLNDMYSKQIKSLDKVAGKSKTQLGLLGKSVNVWENIRTKNKLSDDEIKKINNHIDKLKNNLDDIESPFEDLLNSAIPFGSAITRQKNKLDKIAGAMQKVEQAGGIFNVMQDYASNFSQKLGIVKGGLTKAFGGGMQGMLAKVSMGIKGLIPIVGGLMAALGPILLVVGAIVVAVFILKRMWKNNIGGMQTQWHKFVGGLKDTWHKFVVMFDKLLRKLAPVFKILFFLIFNPLQNAVKSIGLLLKVLMTILSPILDVLGAIGKALLEPFEQFSKKGGKDSIDSFKIMQTVMLGIGKVLGWLAKVALKPLMHMIKMIGFSIKILVKGFKILFGVYKKIFQAVYIKPFMAGLKKLKPIIGMISEKFKKVEERIKKILAPFLKLISAGKKFAKILGLTNEETKKQNEGIKSVQGQPTMASQIYNQQRKNTVNNNSSVVVNSSGAITPENAPGVGNVISSSILTNGRTM